MIQIKGWQWVYVFIIIFTLLTDQIWRNWYNPEYPFQHDVDQYYSYCVAAWIKNDLNFQSLIERGYWLVELPNGKVVQRFTYGMAVMYSPFFLMAHFFSQIFHLRFDGYTNVYGNFISMGTYFYVFIGFFFLRKALIKFYSEKIVAFVIFSLFMCTNLFYYTVGHGEMSHSYLFSIYGLYIYAVISWHETFKNKYLYLALFLSGFATLIRPTDVVNILFFLLCNVYNKSSLFQKIKLFQNHLIALIKGAILFLLPFLLQILYWKIYGGQWIIYTYGKEGFFWFDPRIKEVLFSYRNGIIVYSPIIFLSFLGFIPLYQNKRNLFWSVFLIFTISLYIVSCWWTWWFGGGFGYRAIIQFFAFLAFPMAEFYDVILQKWNFKSTIINYFKTLILVFVVLIFAINNLIRHYQYKISAIHWDSMSKEAFWFLGWKINFSAEDRKYLESVFVHPDYEKALNGIRGY